MSDLFICSALLPVILLIFGGPPRQLKFLMWLPALVAGVFLGYSVYLHSGEIIWWGPLLAFFTVLISDISNKRKLEALPMLAFLFVSQALLIESLSKVVLCLILADMFLNVDLFLSLSTNNKNKAIHNIFKSLFTFLPVLIGVLLQLDGNILISTVALTIVLRLFSWPIPMLVSFESEASSFRHILVGVGSSFALWHVLAVNQQPEWSFIWLCVAGVLSLGAKENEIYVALGLGVFSLSPTLGVLSTAAWPLLLHKGKTKYGVLCLTALAGVFIFNFSKNIILENALYGIAGLAALALARPFVEPYKVRRLWYFELGDFLLASLLLSGFIYFAPAVVIAAEPIGITFASLFLFVFILGKVIYAKKPKLFAAMQTRTSVILPDIKEPVPQLRETAGHEVNIREFVFIKRFFEFMEGESHIVWLLGLMGLVFLWRLR